MELITLSVHTSVEGIRITDRDLMWDMIKGICWEDSRVNMEVSDLGFHGMSPER